MAAVAFALSASGAAVEPLPAPEFADTEVSAHHPLEQGPFGLRGHESGSFTVPDASRVAGVGSLIASETTECPYGGSDVAIRTDERGVVTMSRTDAERECLAEKCKAVSPEGVEALTIDEMCLFPHERSNMQLSDAHAPKEGLRGIYRFSESRHDAKVELLEWCGSARASAIPEMIQMAKTVERHRSGILGYRDFDHASSGSAEGFNTKIRLLVKQSYGIRDFKHLRFKIHDLPSRRIKTHI